MTPQETEQAAQVMLAAARGEPIQVKPRCNGECYCWEDALDVCWDWHNFAFRVKPKPLTATCPLCGAQHLKPKPESDNEPT